MKRRVLLALASAFSLGLSLSASAATVNQDYVVLDKPLANAHNSLAKIWSYACPFCYKFDVSVDPTVLAAVEKSAHLRYLPIHLETKGEQGRLTSLVFAALQIMDTQAGRTVDDPNSLFHKAKAEIYDQYHKMRTRWPDETAYLNTVSQATGLSVAELQKAIHEPATVQLADQWKVAHDIAKIQGVPAYVVNGKYLVLTKSIKSPQSMIALIEQLAKLPQ